jgi:hypothetical protein
VTIELEPTSGTEGKTRFVARVTGADGAFYCVAVLATASGGFAVVPVTFRWLGSWRRSFMIPAPLFREIEREVLAAVAAASQDRSGEAIAVERAR